VGFCLALRAGIEPIPTEALLQLLEEYAHDVDQTADLLATTVAYCAVSPNGRTFEQQMYMREGSCVSCVS
jgi:hypothetical protein